MPMSTYNPKTKRYERDAQKDYSKPAVGKPTTNTGNSQEMRALQAANIILVAKLEAIAKCKNIKSVRAILS